MRSLELSGTQIKDISILSELTHLGSLNLQNNRIRDLSPLKPLKNLRYLWVEANPLPPHALRHLLRSWEKSLTHGQLYRTVCEGEVSKEELMHLFSKYWDRRVETREGRIAIPILGGGTQLVTQEVYTEESLALLNEMQQVAKEHCLTLSVLRENDAGLQTKGYNKRRLNVTLKMIEPNRWRFSDEVEVR